MLSMKSCPWLVTCCIRFAPDPVESSLSTASVACLYFCPVTQYAMPRTEVGHYASSLDVQTQQMQDVKNGRKLETTRSSLTSSIMIRGEGNELSSCLMNI